MKGAMMKVKPMGMLLMMLARETNRRQQDVITYLKASVMAAPTLGKRS
jgi:hypothetical protein